MDVRYINAFMASTRNVFQTMLGMDVEFGKPVVKTEQTVTHDVSGIIGLSGDVVGAVIISFPRLAARRIASALAGIQLTEDHEDFADAIGEISNMIAGSAKKDLDGLNVSISTPSVVIGHGHQVRATKLTPRIVIP